MRRFLLVCISGTLLLTSCNASFGWRVQCQRCDLQVPFWCGALLLPRKPVFPKEDRSIPR